MAECVASDFPLADSGVTIHAGTELGFGVIQMEGDDLLNADQSIDFADGRIPSLGRSNVVASGKKMSRVQAYCQPLRFLHRIKDRRNMPDLASEAASLAGG